MSPLLIKMSFDYGVDLSEEDLIRILHFFQHFNHEIF